MSFSNQTILDGNTQVLSVYGNAENNTLEQYFDSEGFLHLILDGIHYTSNSNSAYYDAGLAGNGVLFRISYTGNTGNFDRCLEQ